MHNATTGCVDPPAETGLPCAPWTADLAVNTEAIVRIVEKYKVISLALFDIPHTAWLHPTLTRMPYVQAWCQAHAAATVEKQEVINERVEEVKRLSSAVIADLTRYCCLFR